MISVVSPCDASGTVSGVHQCARPARTLNVSACRTCVVPTVAFVVLFTSAANPAAESDRFVGRGVGAVPPEPLVV
jgi:hypothetical protein